MFSEYIEPEDMQLSGINKGKSDIIWQVKKCNKSGGKVSVFLAYEKKNKTFKVLAFTYFLIIRSSISLLTFFY